MGGEVLFAAVFVTRSYVRVLDVSYLLRRCGRGGRVKLGQRFKNVSRLNLLFDNEDKAIWERRRASAHKAREEGKKRLRYDFYIRKQSADFRPIQKQMLQGVHSMVADGLPQHMDFPEQVRRRMGCPVRCGLQRPTPSTVASCPPPSTLPSHPH